MTTGVKGFGIEDMVIADTSKDEDPKVTTTCSDCHYNVYRMLGEEAQKLKEPDERGEHYYPFSQNGKIVQVATYIQTAYRDGYKHGHKDGYKNGFDDGYITGRDGITEEEAITFLQKSGWLENHDAELGRQAIRFAHETRKNFMSVESARVYLQQCGWMDKHEDAVVRKAIISRHLMTPEEAKDEFNFEQGKLEGRLEVLASMKDLCNSLESKESWESDACDGCCRANSNFESEHMSAVLKDLYDSLESKEDKPCS